MQTNQPGPDERHRRGDGQPLHGVPAASTRRTRPPGANGVGADVARHVGEQVVEQVVAHERSPVAKAERRSGAAVRSRASASRAVDLTVLTEQPSMAAVSASVRSS